MNDSLLQIYKKVFFDRTIIEEEPDIFETLFSLPPMSTAERTKYHLNQMKKSLKFIHIHYSRFKNRLKIYYSWIWCKKKDLYDYEEEELKCL